MEAPTTTVTPAELPKPLLSDRVKDLEQLFQTGRLISRLSAHAAKLAERDQADAPADRVTEMIRERYNQLRDHLITSIDGEKIDVALYVPVAPPDATLEQVSFIADQTSGWVDALSEVDGFVISQISATVGAMQLRKRATDEFQTLTATTGGVHKAPGGPTAAPMGTYL